MEEKQTSMKPVQPLLRWLPDWLLHYRREKFSGDLIAGMIVTVMLIPQSLAYALLAGLPPQVGLYASILPLVAYALLGSSMTLAVGPVAVASLMTAAALTPLAAPGSAQYVLLATQLAMFSGAMLLLFGVLRLGFLAYFLSHPVISGFISGSAMLIIISQLKHILGVKADAGGVASTLAALGKNLPLTNFIVMAIGIAAVFFLIFARSGLPAMLQRMGIRANTASLLSKLAPMLAVILSTLIVALFHLDASGVKVVGSVPSGLPVLQWVWPDMQAMQLLWLPALLIGMVGFVESVSVAQSLAFKRRQRIHPNRELMGLGAANVASALSGGYPVTGGFARSVVNFAAGANTPLAGVISALLMSVVLVGFTGWFAKLPHAVLAATIIVAVAGLIDIKTLRDCWRYDRADALAWLATAAGVIFFGVEPGIVVGVALSLGALVWRSSRPHMATVGRIHGTEHFRNVQRHQVETLPGVLAVRIDESLFFANSQAVEEYVVQQVAEDRQLKHVVLILSAVNRIDATALEMLTDLNRALSEANMRLHFAEVKGPVMDRLRDTPLIKNLSGKIFLSTHEAFNALSSVNT
jgi:sulfate permease, SulP family